MANPPPTSFIHKKPPPPPPFPAHKKLHKRPLLHPPIPPPSSTSSGPKTIYISHRTPFVSAIKRARVLLGSAPGEVLIKASGRAIEKALQVGLFFLEEGEGVRICTGDIEVLDDVVEVGGFKRKWEESDGEGEGGGEGEEKEEEERGGGDVRRRRTSTVEVWVTKK